MAPPNANGVEGAGFACDVVVAAPNIFVLDVVEFPKAGLGVSFTGTVLFEPPKLNAGLAGSVVVLVLPKPKAGSVVVLVLPKPKAGLASSVVILVLPKPNAGLAGSVVVVVLPKPNAGLAGSVEFPKNDLGASAGVDAFD